MQVHLQVYYLYSVPCCPLEEGCSKPVLLHFCLYPWYVLDDGWCDPPRLFLHPFGCFATVAAQTDWSRCWSPVSWCMVCLSAPDTVISKQRYWGAVPQQHPVFPTYTLLSMDIFMWYFTVDVNSLCPHTEPTWSESAPSNKLSSSG